MNPHASIIIIKRKADSIDDDDSDTDPPARTDDMEDCYLGPYHAPDDYDCDAESSCSMASDDEADVASPTPRSLRSCSFSCPGALHGLVVAILSVGLVGPPIGGVEFFSGVQSITKGLMTNGIDTIPYDLNINQQMDFNSDVGFAFAVWLVLRLQPGGVLFAAPPCSSWVWVSRSSSGRSYDCPLGNQLRKKVRDANILVSRLVLLMALALGRGCTIAWEQPGGTLMHFHPKMRMFMQKFKIYEIWTWMGMYGAPTAKATRLWCSHRWIRGMYQKLDKSKIPVYNGQEMVVEFHDVLGLKRATGRKGLKSSQSYPLAFGEAFANKYSKNMGVTPHGCRHWIDITDFFPDGFRDACIDRVTKSVLGQ